MHCYVCVVPELCKAEGLEGPSWIGPVRVLARSFMLRHRRKASFRSHCLDRSQTVAKSVDIHSSVCLIAFVRSHCADERELSQK